MPKKEIDLDALEAARREASEECPVVKFKGKTFEMPVELPFTIVEAIGRLENAPEEKKNEVAGALLSDIARALFGERFREFLELGPSMNDVSALIEHVSGVYGTSTGESSASGNS